MPDMQGICITLPAGAPASAPKAAAAVVTWVIILVLLAVAAAFVALWIRQRMLREGDAVDPRASLLQQLRRARDSGRMSDEEFRRARDSLLTGSSRKARRAMLKGEVFEDGTIAARRGFDLTGDPLPIPRENPRNQGTDPSAKPDQDPHEPA